MASGGESAVSFPFVALKQPRIRARLDRADVAMDYAAHARLQSFSAQLALGVSK
jgi:hypothetical protein